jgi:hypothetical protein
MLENIRGQRHKNLGCSASEKAREITEDAERKQNEFG